MKSSIQKVLPKIYDGKIYKQSNKLYTIWLQLSNQKYSVCNWQNAKSTTGMFKAYYEGDSNTYGSASPQLLHDMYLYITEGACGYYSKEVKTGVLVPGTRQYDRGWIFERKKYIYNLQENCQARKFRSIVVA